MNIKQYEYILAIVMVWALLVSGLLYIAVKHEKLLNVKIIKKEKEKTINLIGDITFDSVKPVVQILNEAKETDSIRLNVTSPGGDMRASKLVIYALKNTKAKKVVIIVPAIAASAAAHWLGYADEIQIQDTAIVMFHAGALRFKSGESYLINKANSVKSSHLKALYERNKLLLNQCCSKFLTPDEMDYIIETGKDVFFVGHEINERLGK